MKRFLFIGIDFSKSKFDVSVIENAEQKSYAQATFENAEKGFGELLKRAGKQSKIKREDWRFCGEHTGLYSRGLSSFPAKKGLFIWLENPLQTGSIRGLSVLKTTFSIRL
jgi:transposase